MLAVAVAIIFGNTFFYSVPVWYVADVLYVVIAVMFTCCFARAAKHGAVIAVVLWIPAAVVCYAAAMGWLGTEHVVWNVMNPLQLIVYSYLIGARLHIR